MRMDRRGKRYSPESETSAAIQGGRSLFLGQMWFIVSILEFMCAARAEIFDQRVAWLRRTPDGCMTHEAICEYSRASMGFFNSYYDSAILDERLVGVSKYSDRTTDGIAEINLRRAGEDTELVRLDYYRILYNTSNHPDLLKYRINVSTLCVQDGYPAS
ncbi:hypothetical protein Tco_1056710 [Tanacetum coccineum]|uniref:Uncharacterized protein n=1 Tax=Tanacetum coccineum TaxID=301880 RepID=A0ABQ5H3A1_9ASTR